MRAIAVEPLAARSARLEDVHQLDGANGWVFVQAVATGCVRRRTNYVRVRY